MLNRELLALIGRVRRAMPRSVDVMVLCVVLERAAGGSAAEGGSQEAIG